MKTAPLINNFSAGEFGPLVAARTDLDRFNASQELMDNYIPKVQGGASKRGGTIFVAKAADSQDAARLQDFIFSNEQSYCLEFQQYTLRFFTEGAQVLYEGNPLKVETPYESSEIFELSFTQSNDILYIFHENHMTRKLIRVSADQWILTELDLQDGPYQSQNTDTRVKLTSSATTGSTTITSSEELVISNITSDSGNGTPLVMTFSTPHNYKVGDVIYISGVAGLNNVNNKSLTVDVVVDADTVRFKDILWQNTFTYTLSGTSVAGFSIFTSTDVGRLVRLLVSSTWGWAEITAYSTPRSVTATIESTIGGTTATSDFKLGLFCDVNGYASAGTFHEDRLFLSGPFQYLNGSKTSDYENFATTATNGTVSDDSAVSVILNSNKVSNMRWIVSSERGLAVGTSSDEWIVNSASSQEAITPTSIEAKKVTSYGSPKIQPVEAGKSIIFVQASARKIREFNYFFDVDGFRCQDLTQLAHHICLYGVRQIAIQRQPEQIIWGVRNDGTLIACTYERDVDGIRVGWHRHTIGGVYFRNSVNPESMNAFVNSVAVIPTDDNSYDQVWLSVSRDIDGSRYNFIEYMDKPFDQDDKKIDQYFVDSGLSYDVPISITGITNASPAVVTAAAHGFNNGDTVRFDRISGQDELNGNIYLVANKTTNTFEITDFNGDDIDTTTMSEYVGFGKVRKLVTQISGLDHLEGESVRVCGDGVNLGSYTVTSGSITLDEPSAVVHVGLNYKSRIKIRSLDVGSQDGTALGKTKRIHRLSVIMDRSIGLKYGQNFEDMKPFEFEESTVQLNQGPELFSGIKTDECEFDYEADNKICLEHDEPTNSTILAIMPLMVTYDR